MVDPVLRACLFCRAAFPPNDAAEYVGTGRRIAFDPCRGRLWIICSACGRWNLAPLETRWEALEELERLSTQRAHLLATTENIALLVTGRLELVRVGTTTLREQAWWRYGEVLRQRNAWAAFGRARRRKLGRHAWPARLYCLHCHKAQRSISFDEAGCLRLMHDEYGHLALFVDCRCGGMATAANLLDGAVAQHVLRRVLAYRNFAGAPALQLHRAERIVTDAGSDAALIAPLTARQTPLGMLSPEMSLALEIALNEERERVLLRLEAGAVEQRWLEEERIAAIVDRELS
jgi:hypothetical protein